MDKRVVLIHTVGPYAGLWQIVGTSPASPFPAYLPEVDFNTHKSPCSLISVRPRYALYREIMNAEQQRTFNPSQL